MTRPMIGLVISTGLLAVAAPALAGPVTIAYDVPSLDRWMYPFNPTPGVRGSSSVFGAIDQPDFDNRDGQMLVGFDTAADITPGLGADAYTVVSVRLLLETAENETFVYDDSHDSYRVLLDPADPEYLEDADDGQPLELFGVGYRNGLTRMSFQETTPYAFGDPIGQGVRNAYAFGAPAGETLGDVSLSVQERFDPVPWAIGTIDGVAPGALVPLGTTVVFDLDVTNPAVHAYLTESLDDGRLGFAVTCLVPAAPMEGAFPFFYNRENTLVSLGLANPAALEIVVEVSAGDCFEDLDGSGDVGFSDLLTVLATWGACPAECPADLDDSGDVGFTDLIAVLAAWGVCP
ncbi:MAG: hypothetical protein HKO59_13210 [Phycisphaerales bacterium]|nr:hypothetical protein [Phycisphaerae bacterium]NNF42436.1 hypothetical protein [Phycisphaerales bacterium]NNM26921.1 hypothetical protein [Phycisphaerales bacterium]